MQQERGVGIKIMKKGNQGEREREREREREIAPAGGMERNKAHCRHSRDESSESYRQTTPSSSQNDVTLSISLSHSPVGAKAALGANQTSVQFYEA